MVPQTSKPGELPNHTHNPRKIVPLGTMLKNAAFRKSGAIVHDEVVQNPEQQSRKNHSKEKKQFTRRVKDFGALRRSFETS